VRLVANSIVSCRAGGTRAIARLSLLAAMELLRARSWLYGGHLSGARAGARASGHDHEAHRIGGLALDQFLHELVRFGAPA
jgi:hypothetical protein